jgi:hypothetical protein
VATLLESGATVVGVARHAEGLAEIAQPGGTTSRRFLPLAGDASSASFPAVLRALLEQSGLVASGLLVYAPASSPVVIAELAASGQVPLVEILTSAAAEPKDATGSWSVDDLPEAAPTRRRLVLGWRSDPDGPRWHGPDEISAAALAVLGTPGDHVLGVVGPWSERPA